MQQAGEVMSELIERADECEDDQAGERVGERADRHNNE